jgi:hypothetical protein
MKSLAHYAVRGGSVAAALITLAGCAVAPPSGPQVMALPGSGKTYEQFTAEDQTCRQAAATFAGPAPAAQDSTNAAVGSAVLGTALGAAAGAAIGSVGGAVGGGAAVGGALGLLAGSSIGAANAQASAGQLQAKYDTAYTQCMVSKGNSVQGQPVPAYATGPAVVGPAVVVGPAYYGYYGYRPYYYRRY